MAATTKPNGTIVRKKSLPIVSLQPLKRKLDKIETERIHRIIKDGVEKIKYLIAVTHIIVDDSKIFSISDSELRFLLLKHQSLLKKYNIGDSQSHIDVQNSAKEILRCIDSRGITLKPNDVTSEEATFSTYMEQLCTITHSKLLTETQEENAQQKFLLLIMDKARHSKKIINTLTEVLQEKDKEKQHELNEKDRLIRQLKCRLDSMTSSADDVNNTTLNEAAKQILTDNKGLEHKQLKLHQEKMDTASRLDKHTTANYAKESKLRKRKFKMAGELYNWIVKYDQDMGWRQIQIDEITRLNEIDLEDIKQLELHFVDLRKQYDEIMEERKLKKEEEKRRKRLEHLRRRATVKIQALWRGYQTRKEISGKKNKNKGKKGGKKK